MVGGYLSGLSMYINNCGLDNVVELDLNLRYQLKHEDEL